MKLKEIRKAANKTQLQVSKDLNISQQSLCRYETGQNEPDIETLKKLAQYFHVTIDYLVENETPYLIDKSQFTTTQLNIIEQIKNLSEDACQKIEAYLIGFNAGEEHKNNIIRKFNREDF